MTVTSSTEQRWEWWYRHLPVSVLGVGTVVALVTGPATGATSPGWRLATQLAVLALTTGWVCWWSLARPASRFGVLYYTVRSVLAFALTLLNPLFCVFAWVGFIDADDHFRRRGRPLALGATSIIMAFGQSGGVPWRSTAQVGLFALLIAVNFGLASVMSRWAAQTHETSEQRAGTILRLEEALAENARLQEELLAQARTSGVQEERRRLAGEIHDTLAQSLAAVVSQLQAAQDAPQSARARVEKATELAREALAQARRSVQALAPAELAEADLAEALDEMVRAWSDRSGVEAGLVVIGTVRPLHPEVEATVVRIVQESLSNAAAHAGADRVGVTLSYDEDEVIVDVRDDGAGFDASRPSEPGRFGLRGMRQRAERLTGDLAVESAPGAGTAVSARLPALARGAA